MFAYAQHRSGSGTSGVDRRVRSICLALGLLVVAACSKKSSENAEGASGTTAKTTKTEGDKVAGSTGLGAPCGVIELDPALDAQLAIDKVSVSPDDHDQCDVVLVAKSPIKVLSFRWIYFDKDAVKLGDSPASIKGLATGDKLKVTTDPQKGTVRTVSSPGSSSRTKKKGAADDSAAAAVPSADVETLRTKITRKVLASDRGKQSDACLGDGEPPFRYTYGGGTYAEIAQVAAADGCKHYGPDGVNRDDFCCPK